MSTPTRPSRGSMSSAKGMLIGGKWVESASGARIAVENPAKRTPIAECRAAAADVDRGRGGGQGLRRLEQGGAARARQAAAQDRRGLQARAEEMARTIALETGNALRTQARGEASIHGRHLPLFRRAGLRAEGRDRAAREHVLSYTRREPLGVVGAIIPWNAPVMLGALKIAPALCAGNTMVMKAAEDAPLGVLLMAEICQEFLPPGALNVLTGYGEECGGPLANHPDIRKLSFTGSTEVGKIVMRAAAERIVPVSLELGGKSSSIVYPDADEEWAVDGIIAAMRFTRQSQSCTAGSRMFLHEDIFDLPGSSRRRPPRSRSAIRSTRRATSAPSSTTSSSPRSASTSRRASSAPSQLVFGGLPPKTGPLSEGYFAIPTVFADRSNDWRLAREEIFGPVLVAIRWSDEAEVIRMANDSHYGLAAYVLTHDIGAGLRTAHAIESGWVQVNQGGGQVPGMSYGGYKQSGIGREFSLEGMLDSFTQRKSVTVNGGVRLGRRLMARAAVAQAMVDGGPAQRAEVRV